MDFFEKAWPFIDSNGAVFTQKNAADQNRLLVLGMIARRRGLSQRQLSLGTGLHASTMSNIVRQLKDQGLIREGAAIETERVGPKETELEMVPECLWCAGVTLDPAGNRIALVNAWGHTLLQESLPPGLHGDELVPVVADTILAAAGRIGLDRARLGGVGISVPGVVDSETGTILISRSLRMERFPLGRPLQERLGCPVWVERNVTAGAYAEHHAGAAIGRESFIYFLVRSAAEHPLGYGLGLVIGEKVFHGCNSAAGEVDRNLLSPALHEAIAGAAADESKVEAFYEAFAHALTGIVNLLDISCVVLSSNDERLTPPRFERLRNSIAENLVPVPDRRFDLVRSGIGVDGLLLGSSLLALHRGLAGQLAQTTKPTPTPRKRGAKAASDNSS